VLGHKGDRAVIALGLVIAVIATLGALRVGTVRRDAARVQTVRLALPTAASAMALTSPTTALPTSPSTSSGAGSGAQWYPPRPVSPVAPLRAVPFPSVQVPAETILARPNGSIPTFPAPNSAPQGAVGTWYGVPLMLPVIETGVGWLQVRLPWRPNGSTAWVRAGDVTLYSTPYVIVVSVSATQLAVYKGGQQIMDFPVGVGLPSTPTPFGHFFVAIHEAGNGYAYGPVILDTSAHSEVIQRWEGMNDAIVAIHGPINSSADARIGATGTRISNGCIRMHNSDLARLSVIPAGTPIEIIP
jgi:lipoprotein-anchoring transpeptidase ErfK/SrfK